MSQLQILRVVIASPNDVRAERDAIEGVAAELNQGIAAIFRQHIVIYRWETDAYPVFNAKGPQDLIDSVLHIEDCDLFIGIFWKRFGTPTTDAKSGTEHEFQKAYEAWQRNRRPQIMFYFNQKQYAPQSREETDQWGYVLEFKREFPKEGLWWPYNGKGQFEKLIRHHLTQFIRTTNMTLDNPGGNKIPITVARAENILNTMLKEVDLLIDNMTLEANREFIQMDEKPTQVPTEFQPDSPYHNEILRTLRARHLIRPSEGGQWREGKHIEVTPFGHLVLQVRGEQIKERASRAKATPSLRRLKSY